MSVPSEKRQSPSDHRDIQNGHPAKRQRMDTATTESTDKLDAYDTVGSSDAADKLANANSYDFYRDSMRRSISLALQHVGFDSSSVEALDSLTAMTENYLTNFTARLMKYSESARRAQPNPDDFAHTLQKHNIALSALKPHLKNPVAEEKLAFETYDPFPIPKHADYFRPASTEFLGPELDGNTDKKERVYIPNGLPSFPSKHTYKFTQVEAEPVDPRKTREEAVADAEKGEKALRRINRASKISQQKELKEIAQRNMTSKQRHNEWETMMKAMISQKPPGSERLDIADHSVVVDYSSPFSRREVPRVSNKAMLELSTSKG